ncbi:hypothetical protein QYE76_045175 [Lolium multiflorum]|uniref:Reverse transcriptase domain-containing protein n=1 Tax=Lolium multiflorum TaxID=4521 RepID=A0AAD8TM76_LOLMU|nr:hypothetical protein QYE76_045175 [Lolium multiflorum]
MMEAVALMEMASGALPRPKVPNRDSVPELEFRDGGGARSLWSFVNWKQIGRNIEVYIDDIVVKTKYAATLIDDLRETFDNLDKYKIKLNPKKCFFGVPGGQVLGYFISARGIEANPLKIKAILDMEPPKNLHQVQQQDGWQHSADSSPS